MCRSLLPTLIVVVLFFASAIPVPLTSSPATGTEMTSPQAWQSMTGTNKHKVKRLNFIQRAIYGMVVKKMQKRHLLPAEKTPKNTSQTALILGILAIVCALTPWYTIFAAVPLGIIAIITGNNALKSGAAQPNKARTGKTLGIIALALIALWLIMAAIILSSTVWWLRAWG